MHMLSIWYEQILALLATGGAVMQPLVISGFILWFTLGYRLYAVRRGAGEPLEKLITLYRSGGGRAPRGVLDSAVARAVDLSRNTRSHLHLKLDVELAPYAERMGTYASVTRATVLVAPLLGLLGTVTGMIELFASFGTQTFYSQTGGVAQGIADALGATEMGLAVAIPGIVIGRLLERRQTKILEEIERLKEILVGGKSEVTT